jgi:enamine deaminase RidA (YjgF/YER057c/UK114 family)
MLELEGEETISWRSLFRVSDRLKAGRDMACSGTHSLAIRFVKVFPLAQVQLAMTAEKRLAELKIELPPTPKAMGVYKSCIVTGPLAFVSGHAPLRIDGTRITGRVGADLDLAAGQVAARQAGLAILATLRSHFGSLDRIGRVIKILGMVQCTDNFQQHPQVINGCSELFAEIFGAEKGVGARSAFGVNSLPGNIAVEIEAIFEV